MRHRAPAAPATPAYRPEPGRAPRLAREGLYCAPDLPAVSRRSGRRPEGQSRLGGVGHGRLGGVGVAGDRLAALTARLERHAGGG